MSGLKGVGTVPTTGGGGGGGGVVDQGAPAAVGNSWPVVITDGTDSALVTPGGRLQVDATGPLTDTELRASPVGVSVPASTNRIGGAYPVGGNVIDEVPTVRTVNRSFVNATASGNTALVAAQGLGIRIRVLSVFLCTSTAVTVKFQSATTDVSCGSSLAANGGFVMPDNPHGWFQTNANEALNVNLSGAATNVGVQVVWVQAT